jgi:hypothetical protein
MESYHAFRGYLSTACREPSSGLDAGASPGYAACALEYVARFITPDSNSYVEEARAALSAALKLYRDMAMARGALQVEAALVQLSGVASTER